MRIRRCAVVYLEPREDIAFDLGSLLHGGDGLARTRRWIALAPHLGEEVELDADERELLGEVGPGRWIDPADLSPARREAVASLLAKGLLVSELAGAGTDAGEDACSGADAGANTDPGAGGGAGGGRGAGVGADAGAGAGAGAHSDAGKGAGAHADSDADADAGAVAPALVPAGPGGGVHGFTAVGAGAAAGAGSDAGAKAGACAAATAGVDADGGNDALAHARACMDGSAGVAPHAGAQAQAQAEAEAGAKAEAGSVGARGSGGEASASVVDPSALAALRERDDRLRAAYWHPLAATLHAFTRWRDVDTVRNSIDSRTETAVSMRDVLGPPPVEAAQRTDAATHLPLPRSAPTDFDRLLARRVTCRNFDPARPLPRALFAQVLERVFAAKAQVRVTGDTVFLKKSVPSGGGLHPMECYLIVQHVEDVPRGLYHYQAAQHALEPLPAPDGTAWTAESLRGFVMEAVAQQHWFQDAHVLVLLVPRFDRTFWKYRHHAKGYRVIALEGGHLSQTLYLAATDAGLGAFITGAINEQTLERAFGLDPVDQGALAICGFGWRAAEMVTAELDPNGEVWTVAEPTSSG